MRLTWPEIQNEYPNKWVLLKDMQYIYGNLESAVVIYTCKKRDEVNLYEQKNPDKIPYAAAVCYTGEEVEMDAYNDGL